MVLLLPLLLAQVEMARLLVLLTLALQLEATAQWIAELAMDGVGVVSAPGVATVTTELLDTKAKKSVPVVSNDAVKKQVPDDTEKMTFGTDKGERFRYVPLNDLGYCRWIMSEPIDKMSFDMQNYRAYLDRVLVLKRR